MGMIRPYQANSFKFGDAKAVLNPSTNALEFEFDADGIDAVKTYTSFSNIGIHDETKIDANGYVIKETYSGFDETAGQDELNAVGDDTTTTYDDTLDSLPLFDDIVGLDSTGNSKSLSNQYFEGVSIYESPQYSLAKVRSVFDDVVDFTLSLPTGTNASIQIQFSYDAGTTFEAWKDIIDLASTELLKDQPGENVRVKFRLVTDTQIDTTVTPSLQAFTHRINTKTTMMIETNGNINIGGVTNTNYEVSI